MGDLCVRDLMTESPFTLQPDASLATLYDLMVAKHVRHVPIVDEEGALMAIATHQDLVREAMFGQAELPFAELRQMLKTSKIGEIMGTDPETIGPDESIGAAGELMLDNKFGCLPVVDGDRLVGILTRADFVRFVIDSNSDSAQLAQRSGFG